MKLLIQRMANRIGYFIMKQATLDELTNELAATKARLSERNAELWAIRELNRALWGKATAQKSAGSNETSAPIVANTGHLRGNGAGGIGR